MFDLGGSGPSQNTTTVEGSGRNVHGNQYTESGALSLGNRGQYRETGSFSLDDAKNSMVSGLNLAGAQLDKGSNLTINAGPSPDSLQQLAGTLTKASSDQIAALTEANSGQISVWKDLLAQKAETTASSPNLIAWLAAGVLLLLAIVLFKD